MKQSGSLLVVFVTILAAAVIGYFASNGSPSSSSKPATTSLPLIEPSQSSAGVDSTASIDSSNAYLGDEGSVRKEIVGSVYDAERAFRDAAIQATEIEMTNRRQTYPNGWVRWQPLIIDQNDLTNGDYLDENAVEREFLISPFPERTYRATRTLYRPRESTASASWEGVLDDGKSGSIKISIIDTAQGVELRFRLRTPDGQFTIMPTELYGAYVAAESNAAFWKTQNIVN